MERIIENSTESELLPLFVNLLTGLDRVQTFNAGSIVNRLVCIVIIASVTQLSSPSHCYCFMQRAPEHVSPVFPLGKQEREFRAPLLLITAAETWRFMGSKQNRAQFGKER